MPGGEQLALLDEPRGSITLWEFLTGSIRRLDVIDPDSDGALASFAISPDGTHVAVSGRMGRWKNEITVRHIFDGSRVVDLKLVGCARQIIFGSDNASLTVAKERYNRRKKKFSAYVCKWDIEDGEQTNERGPFPMAGTRRRGNTLGYAGIHLSPDGRMLATIRGNRIVVIEVATGRHTTVGPHPSRAVLGATGEFGSSRTLLRALAFDPSGYVLATGAVGSQTVWLWSMAGSSSAEQLLQPDLDSVRALEYSPSGRLLAAGNIVYGKPSRGEVNVWRMKGNELPID